MAKAAVKKSKRKSRSAEIRAVLTAMPERPVVDIAKEYKVTSGLVYNIKKELKELAEGKTPKVPGKRGRKPKVAVSAMPASNGYASNGSHAGLESAFEFVSSVGGLAHAEQLIAKLKTFKEQL